MRDLAIMTIALAIVVGFIGYLNAADISNCMERGNTYEACERAFNR